MRVILALALTLLLTPRFAVAEGSIYGPSGPDCDVIAFHGPEAPADERRTRATMRWAIKRADWSLIEALIWGSADPEWTRGTRWYKAARRARRDSYLVKGAAAGDDDMVQDALAKGADVNLKVTIGYEDYMSPLIWAAACNHRSTVELLLAKGAQVDIPGFYLHGEKGAIDGETALIKASLYAHDDMVELLLSRGADVNRREHAINDLKRRPLEFLGWDTPLLAAGSASTAAILLRHGADPNAVRYDGTTALMGAAESGKTAWCELLLRHGAWPDLRDYKGRTAADLARENKHPDVAELIEHWPVGPASAK